jgi:hypothetical protein
MHLMVGEPNLLGYGFHGLVPKRVPRAVGKQNNAMC